MIPYGRQDISQADIDAVVEILRSDFLTQGPSIAKFESSITEFCGVRHAVAVSNATAALHIACLALDVGPGDMVWTSPNTFVASSNCALYCGASVDFVDIDPQTYNMSVDRLREKLEVAQAAGNLPKVVIPVHLSGQSCEMEAIHALSQEYGFHIIEDASHSIGGSYRGSPVGDCRYSDITVFSFHPVKIVTTGEGGAALTKDDELAEKLRRLRSHGITSDRRIMLPRPDDEIWNYQQISLGFNYRMTDIHAILGISQMTRLREFVDKRRAIAARYDAAFAQMPVKTPWQHADTQSSYHLYPLLVDADVCGKTQKQVYAALWQAGIAVNLHYIPVYRQPYYEAMGFKPGYCPEAEKYYRQAISLPMFPTLSETDQEHVVAAVAKAVGVRV